MNTIEEFDTPVMEEIIEYFYVNGSPLFSYLQTYISNNVRFYYGCCPMQMMNCETLTEDEGGFATLTFFPAPREGNDNLLSIRQRDENTLLIVDTEEEEFILTF